MKNKIVFSKRATKRLESIGDYLYEQSKSNEIVLDFLNDFKTFLHSMLETYPQIGRNAQEYGKDVRKLVYPKHNITTLYKINQKNTTIEILTIFRDNLP